MSSEIRFNAYAILSRAVQEGIEYGYNRAHKHTDTPSEETFKECIENAIMNNICEVMDFAPFDETYDCKCIYKEQDM
jgi:hypothetical protein